MFAHTSRVLALRKNTIVSAGIGWMGVDTRDWDPHVSASLGPPRVSPHSRQFLDDRWDVKLKIGSPSSLFEAVGVFFSHNSLVADCEKILQTPDTHHSSFSFEPQAVISTSQLPRIATALAYLGLLANVGLITFRCPSSNHGSPTHG